MDIDTPSARRSKRRRGRADADTLPKRDVNYRQLRNPFPVMSVFSDDEAANMHKTALPKAAHRLKAEV